MPAPAFPPPGHQDYPASAQVSALVAAHLNQVTKYSQWPDGLPNPSTGLNVHFFNHLKVLSRRSSNTK